MELGTEVADFSEFFFPRRQPNNQQSVAFCKKLILLSWQRSLCSLACTFIAKNWVRVWIKHGGCVSSDQKFFVSLIFRARVLLKNSSSEQC